MSRPEIGRYRAGNAGTDYVWTFAAEAPGPHVMINGLTHGNEPCGAVAVTRLLDAGVRPLRGRLTLSLANTAAYARDPPARFLDRDLNRLWRDDWIDADHSGREAARAHALRPLLASVDALLDLHTTASVATPFYVLADLPKTRALADALAWPPLQQLMPGGCIEGRHLIDYGAFAEQAHPAVALALECGRHDDAQSGEVATEAARRFLAHHGTLATAAPSPTAPIRRVRTVAPYTARSDRLRLLVPASGFVAVRRGQPVAVDGDDTVTAPFDAVITAPRPAPCAGTVAFIWCVDAEHDKDGAADTTETLNGGC